MAILEEHVFRYESQKSSIIISGSWAHETWSTIMLSPEIWKFWLLCFAWRRRCRHFSVKKPIDSLGIYEMLIYFATPSFTTAAAIIIIIDVLDIVTPFLLTVIFTFPSNHTTINDQPSQNEYTRCVHNSIDDGQKSYKSKANFSSNDIRVSKTLVVIRVYIYIYLWMSFIAWLINNPQFTRLLAGFFFRCV